MSILKVGIFALRTAKIPPINKPEPIPTIVIVVNPNAAHEPAAGNPELIMGIPTSKVVSVMKG